MILKPIHEPNYLNMFYLFKTKSGDIFHIMFQSRLLLIWKETPTLLRINGTSKLYYNYKKLNS